MALEHGDLYNQRILAACKETNATVPEKEIISEEDKKVLRRAANRKSARESRLRKLRTIEILTESVDRMKDSNETLRAENDSLMKTIGELKRRTTEITFSRTTESSRSGIMPNNLSKISSNLSGVDTLLLDLLTPPIQKESPTGMTETHLDSRIQDQLNALLLLRGRTQLTVPIHLQDHLSMLRSPFGLASYGRDAALPDLQSAARNMLHGEKMANDAFLRPPLPPLTALPPIRSSPSSLEQTKMLGIENTDVSYKSARPSFGIEPNEYMKPSGKSEGGH
mmetsp:Transcript_6136/g.9329  ORF Transcript_6136/g.9329 Transcript_6136/m.9329 type:complete len:280 (+) Transcript_6136:60-899(+)